MPLSRGVVDGALFAVGSIAGIKSPRPFKTVIEDYNISYMTSMWVHEQG